MLGETSSGSGVQNITFFLSFWDHRGKDLFYTFVIGLTAFVTYKLAANHVMLLLRFLFCRSPTTSRMIALIQHPAGKRCSLGPRKEEERKDNGSILEA
jgi:hypothetical protein